MSASYLLRRLAERDLAIRPINVAIVGAGTMGCAIARGITRSAGMRVALVVARNFEQAARAYDPAPREPVWVSDFNLADRLIDARYPTWTADLSLVGHIPSIDVVVEATGNVEAGVTTSLSAIKHGKKVLSFSAETEALVGHHLAYLASLVPGALYGFADGDQPGAITRIYNEALMYGFDVRGLFNCKGFYNPNATPDSMKDWIERSCGTPAKMISSFTDGTKMQLENNVVANVTGFAPVKRGMTGVASNLATAASDIVSQIPKLSAGARIVDYTLGGDFGSGVFALFYESNYVDGNLLRHLKLGKDGPWRVLFRPYHLCNFEVALSVAEAYLLKNIPAVSTTLTARTVTIAKRPLVAGETLDGSGGFTVRGELAREDEAQHLLPISLSDGARVRKDVAEGDEVQLADVEIKPSVALDLWNQQQDRVFAARLAG